MSSTDTSKKTSKGKAEPRDQLLLKSSKILLNSSLRLLLSVLPNIPIRIKQLTVKHQVSTTQQPCFSSVTLNCQGLVADDCGQVVCAHAGDWLSARHSAC